MKITMEMMILMLMMMITVEMMEDDTGVVCACYPVYDD